jgi:hypothetical protein
VVVAGALAERLRLLLVSFLKEELVTVSVLEGRSFPPTIMRPPRLSSLEEEIPESKEEATEAMPPAMLLWSEGDKRLSSKEGVGGDVRVVAKSLINAAAVKSGRERSRGESDEIKTKHEKRKVTDEGTTIKLSG